MLQNSTCTFIFDNLYSCSRRYIYIQHFIFVFNYTLFLSASTRGELCWRIPCWWSSFLTITTALPDKFDFFPIKWMFDCFKLFKLLINCPCTFFDNVTVIISFPTTVQLLIPCSAWLNYLHPDTCLSSEMAWPYAFQPLETICVIQNDYVLIRHGNCTLYSWLTKK